MTLAAIGWRLATRDLRGGLGGLGLLFACLLLAIAGLSAVLSLTAAMESAIDSSGRDLLAGDLKFEQTQRPATAAELDAIRSAGRVSRSVATRAMLVAESDVALVELRGVDAAFPLAGELLVEGRAPRGADEIAVDRGLGARLELAVGDSVSLGSADYRVVGLIDKMPGGTFLFAPPALVSEAGLSRSGIVVPGALVDYEVRLLLDDPSADLDATAERLEADLEPVGWDVDTREGAAGGTQRFVRSTGDMLLFVAIAALGIGALGIASAMRAFAAGRRATVARLKLLGAQTAPLGAMLGIEILLVTLAALLPGLAIGASAPAIVAELVGDRLPLTPDPGPHWGALTLAAAVGLLVTLAASWRPLASALRTPPRALLRSSGAEAEFRKRDFVVPTIAGVAILALLLAGAGQPRLAAIAVGVLLVLAGAFAVLGWAVQRIARGLAHRGGPVVRLAVAALDRPGNATRRLIVSLGLGLALLVALAAGGQSLTAELETAIPGRAPSHFILDVPKDSRPLLEDVVERHAPGATLNTVPSIRGSVSAVDGIPVADLPEERRSWLVRGDRGLTFAADLPEGNRVTAGEWWDSDYAGPPLVSLESEAARDLGLGVGDTITFSIAGREITATIAALREVDWRSFGFNFGIVFAPGTLEAAPYTYLANIVPAGDEEVTPGFERALSEALPMVSAIAVSDVLAEIRAILGALDAAIRIATLLAIAIGVVVLAGSVVATRAQRAREVALLRLVGARSGQLVASQLVEFAILSSVAVALAVAVGLGMAYAAIRWTFEIAFRPDAAGIALLAVGAVALAVGAAMLAVRPALRRSPTRMLRAPSVPS